MTATDRVKAAQLRRLAVAQEHMARRYQAQASRPIYAGQDMICADKAAQCDALAAENRAKADLLDARGG